MKKRTLMIYILGAVLIAGGIYYYLQASRSCDASGGVLVRGAVGYSCVARPGR